MRKRRNLFFVFGTVTFILAANVSVFAQDAPSLGDLARQQREQKEHAKTAQGKDAKAPKVITNEEIPEHSAAATTGTAAREHAGAMPASASGPKQPAEYWKSKIEAQKSQIATLQKRMDEVNDSIKFAPPNCVSGCVEWNQHQQQKQEQVERMQAQLEEQKNRLSEMQDGARGQGYGSSVYDP